MIEAFDNRLVTLGIQVEGQAAIVYDQGFDIQAAGTKFANTIQGQCQLKIDNISTITRNNLLTLTSPFRVSQGNQRVPVLMWLDVGRASYGTFRLFQGNVLASQPTQPPNIGLTLTSQTLSFMLGNNLSILMPETSTITQIAQQIAANLGVALVINISQDKSINNYRFQGSALKQMQKLSELGNLNVFVDNNTLYVRDGYAATKPPILISSKTGMVGVPEVTEQGVRVRCLILNEIKTTDCIQIVSKINPAANGVYNIYRLSFEVATRDTPFYWVIEATNKKLGFSTYGG